MNHGLVRIFGRGLIGTLFQGTIPVCAWGDCSKSQKPLPGEDLNQVPPKYKSRALPTQLPAQYIYLRVLVITDVATESTPALRVDLQGRDNFCIIPCRKVSYKLHSIGLTLVREQVSEVCCHRNSCLTQLH